MVSMTSSGAGSLTAAYRMVPPAASACGTIMNAAAMAAAPRISLLRPDFIVLPPLLVLADLLRFERSADPLPACRKVSYKISEVSSPSTKLRENPRNTLTFRENGLWFISYSGGDWVARSRNRAGTGQWRLQPKTDPRTTEIEAFAPTEIGWNKSS